MSPAELILFLAWLGTVVAGLVGFSFWVWPRAPKLVGYTASTVFFALAFAALAPMVYVGAQLQQDVTLPGFMVGSACLAVASESQDRRRENEMRRRDQSER